MNQINAKIVGFKVLPNTPADVEVKVKEPSVIHENIQRPEHLFGSTYKIKTPDSDHALYITINDYELEGKLYPYEIFINSKNMEHYQWVVALTRLISAVFRKGGDSTFLIEELKSVFDPKGGYRRGPVWVGSLVAEIGLIIEKHMKVIGLIKE